MIEVKTAWMFGQSLSCMSLMIMKENSCSDNGPLAHYVTRNGAESLRRLLGGIAEDCLHMI